MVVSARIYLISHRELACYYSPVFKAAFNSRFVGGETQTYGLDDVRPAVARLLIHVSGICGDGGGEGGVGLMKNSGFITRSWISISIERRRHALICSFVSFECLTYPLHPKILADELMIPSLKNLVIWELERLRKRFHTISTHCLNYVYENTESESPLRMLFLHWCAFNMVESRFKEKPEHFPKEMLLDLAVVQSRALPKKTGELKSRGRDMMMFKVEEQE
ncbi:hypothetical protein LSUB1_G005412 [Lachnellula subtilissima]|uniref:BTB domain-containing protein n=1 Tax=Lachnellula subtilissima TaxID=602034 RepID=A0A8H8RIC1_9HELO|nr:hypothetical protein LSUB1_G005412 [Lachnellula subtilissima]